MNNIQKTVTNFDVTNNKKLINSGRFNIHGSYNVKGEIFTINVDPCAPSAGFSISKESNLATPIEDFLNNKTETYLIALGIGLIYKDKIILGRRPENISIAPNKLTIAGGRVSERPSTTAIKELAEEFVILVTNGEKDCFVRFGKKPNILLIQTHAIESLPYSIQALSSEWIVAGLQSKPLKECQTVIINIDNDNYHFDNAIPCVINEYSTIDVLLPYELILPNEWRIKEVFFTEHKDLKSVVATPNEIKKLYSSELTQWASALVNNLE